MVDCQEEQAKSSSHKNEKIKSYTLSFSSNPLVSFSSILY